MNLIHLADNLFSRYARISRADDSGGVDCVCCGHSFHWGAVDCAHFVIRGHLHLRWDINNAWPCCRDCHEKGDHLARYKAGLVAKFGEGFVEELIRRGKEFHRAPTREDLTHIIEVLSNKLEEYADKKSLG